MGGAVPRLETGIGNEDLTKRWLQHRLFSFFSIPLVLNQWTPVPVGSFALPSIQSSKNGWQIQTAGTAGGFLYPFGADRVRALSDLNLSWSWKVDLFPTLAKTDVNEKDADDFALRVGLVIGGDGEASLPKDFDKAVHGLKDKVSYVLFYSATDRKEYAGKCFKSPFSNRVVNCLKMAGRDLNSVRVTPLSDLLSVLPVSPSLQGRLIATGIWVFADSDNSKSASQATLSQLKVEERGMAAKWRH